MKWENNNKADSQTNKNDINGDSNQAAKERVPFIIQKIGRGTKSEIEEITRMCIDVFFNEQKEDDIQNSNKIGDEANKKQTPPWKALQLAYLGNMQQGDLLARNAFKKNQLVDLIVARRVYPVTGGTKINLIDDTSQIFNVDQLPSTNGGGDMYMTGDIIGYCEVSEKNFGLGGNFETTKRRKISAGEKPRPYLSNLSVVEYARQSGVGSKLMDACEDAVRNWNVADHTEIVLQVEEDNPTAIQFYKRRGWEFAFADPTCRRFDTSGFFLKETRITKYAMVKWLDKPVTTSNGSSKNGDGGGNSDFGSSIIQKLRKSFFVQ